MVHPENRISFNNIAKLSSYKIYTINMNTGKLKKPILKYLVLYGSNSTLL